MALTANLDLTQLPLILAGPILRRTEANQVSVWIALQAPATIQLQVLPTDGDRVDRADPLLQGSASTIAMGQSVHLALITAQAISEPTASGASLSPGQLYAYDLTFHLQSSLQSGLTFSENSGSLSLQQALRSPQLPDVNVSYFAHGLPTFALPPADLNHLKILHGSCRKLHDKELDALPIVDQMIAEFANSPHHRPQQLFFTGDQIYGDEVADVFLWGIQQFQPTLFGWKEKVLKDVPIASNATKHLKPGKRYALVETHAGLTASMQGDRHKTQSHLLRFSEYCTSYLFAWSECLWNFPFPYAEEVGHQGKTAKRWNQQVQHLHETARSQPAVRRALANIATYMIFDDHDISDDWNLNQDWCLRVLGRPLGRQTVRNALLSYALFQGWGNTPTQFFPNTIGADLLAATERWTQSEGHDQQAIATIEQALGMPLIDPVTDLPQLQADETVWILQKPEHSLDWHYRVAGPCHEVLVLDTRTQRGYPIDQAANAPPQLLSPTGFRQQLQTMLQADPSSPLTFIVAPTNVFTLGIIDRIQRFGQRLNKTYDMDIGDAWNLESNARSRLVQELLSNRQQVIILSGDIHFGAALRLDYWHQPPDNIRTFPQTQTPADACLVQLVASAICNSEVLTEILQTKIKQLFPEQIRYWIGYANEDQEREIRSHFWSSIGQFLTQWFRPQDAKSASPQIEWGYRSQWLQRQPAQIPPWQQQPIWLQAAQAQHHQLSLLRRLWRKRWLQEGTEVLGLNNVGLVQLNWPTFAQSPAASSTASHLAPPPIVIYDLYWYAPWQAPHIVYSRFQTSLRPE